MKLFGFKYLRRHRVLILAIIVMLISMLFSITAFSLLGFYSGFNTYLGEGGDIIAVYDRKSRTPFTGLVPSYLAERIKMVNGVLASSLEVLAPCIVKDESVFIRGVIPEEFSKLNPLTVLDGGLLSINDFNSAIVGRSVAEKLGLKPGDRVLVLGVLTESYLELQVKGVYRSNSPLDDEIIVPLYVGQWLRGAGYGQVTLIRVKIDKSLTSQTEIYGEMSKEASEPVQDGGDGSEQERRLFPRTSFIIDNIGVEEAQKFMRSYLDQYGVTEETLLILSVIVFTFSSASVVIAIATLIRQHRLEIGVLRSLGTSNRMVKMDLLVKALSASFISSALGIIVAASTIKVIGEMGYLQVLSHRIIFQFNPLIVIMNCALISILVTVSIACFVVSNSTSPS